MRRLASVLVLLASAAHAQPDAALIDSVVVALRAEEAMATRMPGLNAFAALTGAGVTFSPATVADSIRARLAADYRPDFLRAALPVLQSGPYQRAVVRQADRSGGLQRAALYAFGDAPKKGLLADSVLAVRYLAATGGDRVAVTTMARTVRAMVEGVPSIRAEVEQSGQSQDAFADSVVTAFRESVEPFVLPAMRAELAGVPVGDVEALIAYHASPAGRHVQTALVEGTIDALVPALLAVFSTVTPGAGRTEIEPGEPAPESVPKPLLKP